MSFLEDNLGKNLVIGSYTFTPEEIIEFARKYDPQPFHLDAEAARNSVFGGLCASGWHTTAVFMKLNVASIVQATKDALKRGETPPTFGPSPGFENLKWPKPVYAGDTITYKRMVHAIRPMASRPGWSMLTMTTTAHNQNGEEVLSFDNAAMVKLPPKADV
ncbi:MULTISPECIES: MaoC family dehydratase [Brucella/Ochrobactrum group]|jgi:acyl dehydratase|uniref:MaoC family dehydratase n=1 Tax=Brucella pseudintermedia TaxID=370111 RepID=A0ABY5UFS0_9HYPH|nr:MULTISPECIES: MaoC family dehydratase [Brucella/Ochrobactrum group]KAB2685387.1 MaoC family dehydratase [Brucella pseudintermedia]MCO7725711.1 MaoC family dehydratase [Brucella intermedia]NKE76748.1 MaoC family dehydratase [Ochrobactrum sp. MC-1LL]TWG98905.1 acyl dehydratase [Ochrobactrum sp. J50]UWL61197.1 MaoC family dehydratase [Brucella pseudintermedia]